MAYHSLCNHTNLRTLQNGETKLCDLTRCGLARTINTHSQAWALWILQSPSCSLYLVCGRKPDWPRKNHKHLTTCKLSTGRLELESNSQPPWCEVISFPPFTRSVCQNFQILLKCVKDCQLHRQRNLFKQSRKQFKEITVRGEEVARYELNCLL